MFKCNNCKRLTKPCERSYMKIVETRKKTYLPIKNKDGTVRTPEGWEIVKEKRVCKDCKDKENK